MATRKASKTKTSESNGKAAAMAKPKRKASGRNGKATKPVIEELSPADSLTEKCKELMVLQRRRSVTIKCRVAIGNRLIAIVKVMAGYNSGLDAKLRAKHRKMAVDLIKQVVACNCDDDNLTGFVLPVYSAMQALKKHGEKIAKDMEAIVKTIPRVVEFVEDKRQRGFGYLSAAMIVGEAGDLNSYACPSRLWKRFGMWPYRGRTPSAWRNNYGKGKFGKLTKEEWEEQLGYCPRRRSVAYMIGEALCKSNGDGPYRRKYDDAKRMLEFADKTDYPKIRKHRHGMLLATKFIFKEFWIAWTNGGLDCHEQEQALKFRNLAADRGAVLRS